jgi:Na+-transporting methylmalonyl-CoA/oxaloacetate decarboxylase gamma subunit
MAEPTRTDHPSPQGPRIRYPILLGGLGVGAFLILIIVIVIVVRATGPAEQRVTTDEDETPTQTSIPPAAEPEIERPR